MIIEIAVAVARVAVDEGPRAPLPSLSTQARPVLSGDVGAKVVHPLPPFSTRDTAPKM